MGMLELFWIFLLFFPAQPYGKPAPAAKVVEHVPPGAALVLAIDAASLGQGMNQGLDRVLGAKFIRNTPALQQAAAQIEHARVAFTEQAKQYGVDPFRDVRYATVSLGDLDAPEPTVLAVFGGNLTEQLLEGLAAKIGAQRQGALWVLPKEGGQIVMTRARDGALLLGSRAWVELALAGKARNPQLAPLLSQYDRDTFALVAFQPSEQMRAQWRQEVGWGIRPLLTSLEGIGLRLGFSGWSLQVISQARAVPAWKDLFYGLGRLAVASRETADGGLYIAKAWLASLDPVTELGHDLIEQEGQLLAALVEHRDEIHKLLSGLLVGPSPKTRVMVQRVRRSVSLHVTGKTASLALVPLVGGVLGYFLMAPAVEAPLPPEVEPLDPEPSPEAPGQDPTPE